MNDYMNHKWQQFLRKEKKIKNKRTIIEVETKGERHAKSIPFPKLRISEEWGKPRSADRQEIRRFSRKVKGKDLRSKVQSINDFINDCKTACINKRSVGEMISNLVLLDALAAIIYDFNASAGGFLFEGFVAMMLGGQSRQVVAGKGGIEDIITNTGEKVSLKFFKEGSSSDVGGSLADLRDSIEKGKPMKYLVVLKETGARSVTEIKFYEFTVGTRGKAFRVKQRKPTPYRDPETGEIDPEYEKTGWEMEKEEIIEADFYAEDYTKGIKDSRGVPSLTKAPHFEISQAEVTANIESYTLKFGGPKFMKNLAETYVNVIGNDIGVIYEDMAALSENLTAYFIDENMSAGAQASKIATEMPEKIRDVMSAKVVDETE